MKPARIGILALVSLLAGLLLLGLGLRKSVTLVVDGQSQKFTTYALTVGGMLQAAQVPLAAQDALTPPADRWLWDGETVILQRAVPVQVLADGKLTNLLSAQRKPSDLLALAGIVLSPGDRLLSNGIEIAPAQVLSDSGKDIGLQVIRSVPFTLRQGSQVQALFSPAPSLGQALWDSGIVLRSSDRLDPPAGTPLTNNLAASLQRARPITIQTMNGSLSQQTAADTVGEALTEAGLALQGLDYSIPAAERPIPADGLVKVVRVREEVTIEQTPIEFVTAYQPDPDLEIDNQTILQQGAYGLTAKRVRVRYEDGQEVSRQVENEWVAQSPKPRIVGYGTKLLQHTLSTPDGTITYWRALTMWATSYSPASAGGDTTASGDKVKKGIVGINPNYIPYGTRLYIPGYGFGKASDTGNIGPRWIDLGYSDDDYVAWHQYVTVYFLWPLPDKIVWIIP